MSDEETLPIEEQVARLREELRWHKLSTAVVMALMAIAALSLYLLGGEPARVSPSTLEARQEEVKMAPVEVRR